MRVRTSLIAAAATVVIGFWMTAAARVGLSASCPVPTLPASSSIVRANLRRIADLLYTYANENESAFPSDLSTLVTWYYEPLNPCIFWNPGDSDPCPAAIDNDEPNAPNSAQVSFRYFGGGADDGRRIVLQDDTLANNGGAGVHAMLADGSVHFFSPMASTPPLAADGQAKLEQIGAALNAYAGDHGGQYPPVLSALYPTYISDPQVFWNSGDTFHGYPPPPVTINNDTPDALNSAQISFVYLGAGRSSTDDPHAILVQDNSPANNGGLVISIRTIGSPARSYVASLNCESPTACRAWALANLKAIGLGMYAYANENLDAFPLRLSMLVESRAIQSPDTFWNPGDSDPRPLTIDNDLPDHENSTQITYAYFGGRATLPGSAIVLQDNALGNNQGNGLLVLTADGKAEFVADSAESEPGILAAQANLMQIGQALDAYAAANAGQYPSKLSLLYPQYIADPAVFWNPGEANPQPTAITNDTPNATNSSQISYHYRGAGYTTAAPQTLVLVSDNDLANNAIAGMNVLRRDGGVGFYRRYVPACPSPWPPSKQATQIVIAGPDAVLAGKTADYFCTATFDDAAVQDVTNWTGWSVSVGQGALTTQWVGECVQRGVYQAPPSVAGDTFVTLKAVYYGSGWRGLVSTKTVIVQADSDGDGVPDNADACADTVPGSVVDAAGCPTSILGDADADGDVDGADFTAFAACRSGPGVPAAPSCAALDRDGDLDVDLDDFGVFQRCYSGSCVPADPACAD